MSGRSRKHPTSAGGEGGERSEPGGWVTLLARSKNSPPPRRQNMCALSAFARAGFFGNMLPTPQILDIRLAAPAGLNLNREMTKKYRYARWIYLSGVVVMELLFLEESYRAGGFERTHTTRGLLILAVIFCAYGILWPVILVTIILGLLGVLRLPIDLPSPFS